MLKPGDIIIATKPYIEDDPGPGGIDGMMMFTPATKVCRAFMAEPCVFIASTLQHVVVDVRSGADFISVIMPMEEFQAREFVRADRSLQLVLTKRLIAARDATATPPGSFMQLMDEVNKHTGRRR